MGNEQGWYGAQCKASEDDIWLKYEWRGRASQLHRGQYRKSIKGVGKMAQWGKALNMQSPKAWCTLKKEKSTSEDFLWQMVLLRKFLPSSNIRFLTTVWFSEDKNLKDFRYYLRKGTYKFPSHSSQRLLQGLFIRCTSISKRGSVCVWIFSLTPLASVFIKTRFSSNVSPMQRFAWDSFLGSQYSKKFHMHL